MSETEDRVSVALSAVAELATLARRAAPEWIPAWTRPTEDDEPEANPPEDERNVLVFLNGHVDILDEAGREGGGHGIRMGFYEHERSRWRVGGKGAQHRVGRMGFNHGLAPLALSVSVTPV